MADTAAQRAWVERVLGATFAPPRPAAAAAAPKGGASRRLASVEANYLRAVKAAPEKRSELGAVMAFINEQIEAGDEGRAGKALDRLEGALAGAAPPAKPTMQATGESLFDVIRGDGQKVAYRKILLRWDAAKKQARSQIDGLKSSIAAEGPELAKAAGVLDTVMDKLNDDLADAIDAALNATGASEQAREHARAADLARSCLMTVNFDPLFRAVDDNPLKPLTLRATLGGALKELVSALPA